MNESKVQSVLSKSGRCYIPTDDPPQGVVRAIAEVSQEMISHSCNLNKYMQAVFNGAGDMKNYAGKSLEDQEPRRLCVITCKEFLLCKGYDIESDYYLFLTSNMSRTYSKLVLIAAPPLPAESSQARAAVEDLRPKMNKFGPDCVLYDLSFCSVVKDWKRSMMKYDQ